MCCDSWGRKESDTTERLICPSMHQWTLRLLSVLASINTAAVNVGVQIAFQVTDFVLFR